MTDNLSVKKIPQYVRNNYGFIMMLGVIALLIFNPAAKAWVMQQLLRTGIFNAQLTTKAAGTSSVQDFSVGFKDGKTVHITSLRGKVVFINFWASWCPPCRAEFPGMVKLYQHFKNNDDVVFLFIDEDNNLSTGERFLLKENYDLPIAIEAGDVPSAIYNGSLPTTAIIDKSGKLIFHHEGFAGYGGDEFIGQLEELVK